MKHINTVAAPKLNIERQGTGCGECRSSCQSACKTSCTVGNQSCEQRVAVLVKGAGRYCFANQGDYHGKRENMPLNVALKAVDMLIAKSGSVKNLEMDFFGGEPLMNFDVLRQTVSYAKEQAQKAGKIFKFTCTTNGLLLDREKSDYLNEEMDNVVLSLDGRREAEAVLTLL